MADAGVYYRFDLRGLALREIPHSEPKCLPCSDENAERHRGTSARSTMLKSLSLAVPKATLAGLKLRVVLNDGNTKQLLSSTDTGRGHHKKMAKCCIVRLSAT